MIRHYGRAWHSVSLYLQAACAVPYGSIPPSDEWKDLKAGVALNSVHLKQDPLIVLLKKDMIHSQTFRETCFSWVCWELVVSHWQANPKLYFMTIRKINIWGKWKLQIQCPPFHCLSLKPVPAAAWPFPLLTLGGAVMLVAQKEGTWMETHSGSGVRRFMLGEQCCKLTLMI